MGDPAKLDADRETFKERYLAVYGADAPRRSMGADVSLLYQFVHQIALDDFVVYRSHKDYRLP
jgi:predicted Mrr-cat superfamily restriction endonuclease